MQRSLQLGKRPGRTLAATSATGLPHLSRLFYVRDTHTGTQFLVDTGSEVSVIPPSLSDCRHPPDKLTLTAVNDTSIPTYGRRSLTLNIGLRRSFPWIFVVADIQKPILGADFLRHYKLLVDMKQHQLTDSATHLRVQGIFTSDTSPGPAICPKDPSNPYLELLSEFPVLTQPCSLDNPVKHDVTHHIETVGSPVFSRPRRLAPERLQCAKQEFKHMDYFGIVQCLVLSTTHGAKEVCW